MPPIFSKAFPLCSETGIPFHTSPCEQDCPAGNPVQAVHTFIREGHPELALKALLSSNPFPGITGRVCQHPCERRCNRSHREGAVSIRMLERYASEQETVAMPPLPVCREKSGKRISVIGAGMAGLTAAYFLRLLGHEVTVYEAAPVVGGTPRLAIPDFRLPKDVADRETCRLLASGMHVHTNVRVGRDISLADIMQTSDACLLACGVWKERILDIPGACHLKTALSWLRGTTLERESLKGKKVVILGGGGVAFDCAFTARRLSASSVSLVCPEAEHRIKITEEELQQARAEGIHLYASHLSTEVREEGRLVVARPLRDFFFTPEGRLVAEFAKAESLQLEADVIICASGLLAELSVLNGVEGVELTPRGMVKTTNFATSVPGLFAAGDVADGPSLVTSAVGSGRHAAAAVHAWLCQEEGGDVRVQNGRAVLLAAPGEQHEVAFEDIMHAEYHESIPRHESAPEYDSLLPFAELDKGLSAEDAVMEASRCMHCGHCMDCGSCVEHCPGHILERTEEGPRVLYPQQCWHCGCCRIACPTGSIAYRFPLTMLV